jgi:UDP:flavonoid glycosyltransferase YjiC (YdhE family)
MRILFTACPMYGHVNTQLPLARAAQRAGHEVVFATGGDLTPHVARAGLEAWPVGPTHKDAGGGPDADGMAYFADSAGTRAIDLMPRAIAWQPDLVIAEETELAGPVVAAVTGARHVVHGLGIMPPMSIWTAFSASVQGLYERWSVTQDAQAIRTRPYLEICPPGLRGGGERIWSDTRAIRPSFGEALDGEALPAEIAGLPYADTVHLTLGTVFHGNRSVLETALAGLRRLPVNVVVAAGPGIDPREFGPQPTNVHIAGYVRHDLLLPTCRVVVSQGGAGVLFGSLAHGLPHLVLPQGAEQFMNAEAAAATGAALVLTPDEVTASAVTAAVTRLLRYPSFSGAAEAMRDEIATMPDADAVLETLTQQRPAASNGALDLGTRVF